LLPFVRRDAAVERGETIVIHGALFYSIKTVLFYPSERIPGLSSGGYIPGTLTNCRHDSFLPLLLIFMISYPLVVLDTPRNGIQGDCIKMIFNPCEPLTIIANT
jgi:hypothetical protein